MSNLPFSNKISLFDLRKGQSGVVSEINADSSLPAEVIRRLIELGFVVGERVRVLAEMFPYRDPIAVCVGNTQFALRQQEAKAIWVMPD